MTSSGSFPVPIAGDSSSLPSSVPVVNTIQSVRSPIWSVPSLSEGHLNLSGTSGGVGGAVGAMGLHSFGGISIPADTTPAPVENSGSASPSRVVVRQIAPKQSSPTKANLAHIASQLQSLTSQQMQALMKSLTNPQGHQSPSLPLPQSPSLQSHPHIQPSVKPVLPMPSSSTVAKVSSRVSGKPIMPSLQPKQTLRGSGPATMAGGPTLQVQQKVPSARMSVESQHLSDASHAGSGRLLAPVVVPPHNSSPFSASLEYHHKPAPPPPPPPPPPPSAAAVQPQPVVTTSKPRKPCNCKNSQCLKLYCDCFANGEFCRDGCHCQNCKNNIQHAEDRAKAVKLCLDRNPHAFKPKVGKNKAGDERRHIKGCNCKRSGCLKNYCECYEAKIPCSSLCRCVACKNVPDKPENKSLMQLADAADIRTRQQKAATSHFLEQLETATTKPQHTTRDGHRLPFSFVNKEVAKATCLCLLEEASHAAMNGRSEVDVERMVLEEFGRCMTQIISSAQNASEEEVVREMMVH